MNKSELEEKIRTIADLEGFNVEVKLERIDGMPDQGDTYFFITSTGNITQTYWESMYADRLRLKFNNVFYNKEDAIKYKEKLTLFVRMSRFASKVNGCWIPDWNSSQSIKYYCYYDYEKKEWDVYKSCTVKNANEVYFATEELARRAIDEVIIPFFKEEKESEYDD